jgi:hypothetical protein
MNHITKILFFLLLFSADAFAQDSLNPYYQKRLATLVEDIRKPRFSGTELFNFERKYFNKKIKDRLLEVLSNKWTDKELNVWVQKYVIEDSTIQYSVDFYAKEISKRKKIPYQKARDSLQGVKIEQVKERTKQGRIDNNLILLVGWLDMQEAIPVLKNALQNSRQYNNEKVRLSLARLGVEPYYSEALKYYSVKQKNEYGEFETDPISDYYQRGRRLLFICTPASIEVASQWLKSTKKVNPLSEGNYLVPLANFAVVDLSEMILNEDFRKICNPDKFQESAGAVKPKELEFCKKWILSNKSKMILNREKAFFIGFLN